MLTMIMNEPPDDCDKDRGHTMPFHTDMIFQMNKSVINARFFTGEVSEGSNRDNSSEKKSSPHKMIDVFMTPQSDDSISEESISPTDVTSPPDKSEDEAVSTFSPDQSVTLTVS